MKELVLFSLNKRFRNRMTVIMNLLLLVILGFAAHIDWFMTIENTTICLDQSISRYHERFLKIRHEGLKYETGNEGTNVLCFDDGWVLKSDGKLDDNTVEEIRNDIIGIITGEYYEKADLKTKGYIDEYNKITLTQLCTEDEEDGNQPWVIVSVVYFLILSYSNLIANEVVYEKATNTLGLILTSVSERTHFLSKILIAYLSLFLQGFALVLMVSFWLIERYLEDRLQGLLVFLVRILPAETVSSVMETGSGRLLFTALLVMAGILTIQTLMLIFFSGFTNSDDTGTYQAPFYLAAAAGYYFLLIKGTAEFFKAPFSIILSFVPVFSMIFMPCRMSVGDVSWVEIIISLILAVSLLVLIILMGMPVYRKRILNDRRK
ncbi:MAG: ABC transporter permease [Erysipelotrichaceae bacterium]|nr:ABC transporter permease [Erysipelotrichaceae bacterium]